MGVDMAVERHAAKAERITKMEEWNNNVRTGKRN